MSNRRQMILTLAMVVALLALSGCGLSRTGDGPAASPSPPSTASPAPSPPTSPSPTGSPAPSPARPIVVSAYFMRGHSVGVAHRQVAADMAVAGVAMRELLAGPNQEELAAGLHTRIPPGTRLLGLSVRAGVATLDLSTEFTSGAGPTDDRGRLAQVVYTLTQFSTVDGVRFMVEGEPLVFRSGEGAAQTRRSFEDVTPAILIERPAVGDEVSGPLEIAGTANTFEAQFIVRLLGADGHVLSERSIMATSGSGARGIFSETLRFTAAPSEVILEAYEPSAADGRPTNTVRIPLRVTAAAQ